MGLVLLGAPVMGATATFAREQSLLARVTVYWTRKHQTATSVRLRVGHCAVDPKRIPYGSKVLLPDTTLTAVDTGKHVITRRAARKAGRTTLERNALVVDRFFETQRQALSWVRTNPHFMTVRVLPPNYRPGTLPSTRVVAASPKPVLIASNAPQPGSRTAR